MANRFPLVVDSETNEIKEIPAGDNLDFTSVGVANLGSLSVAGAISGATISSTGNLTVGGDGTITGTLSITGTTTAAGITASGTVDAANFTVGGDPLSSIQVQSDWNESNTSSAAFIKNKPSLAITVNNLTDIGDVFFNLRDGGAPGDAGYVGDVLTWDGSSWSNAESTGNVYTFLTASGTPSGQGSISAAVVTVGGVEQVTLTYNPPTAIGIGAATSAQGSLADSAVQPGASLGVLDNSTTRFVAFSDVQASDPITVVPISGNSFAIGFDNAAPGAGFLTAESDTLATVTGRGALTTTAITVPSITANDNATASSFQAITALSITFEAGGLDSVNGDITLTNGSISATNGTVTGLNLVGTNQISTTGLIDTPLMRNGSGDLTLQSNAGGRVQITQGYLKLPSNASRPATGETGDLHWNGQVLEMYTSDDGGTNAGWLHLAGDSSAAQRGFIIPNFTTTERNALTPAPGEMILNSTSSRLEIYTGPTFGWRGVTLS